MNDGSSSTVPGGAGGHKVMTDTMSWRCTAGERLQLQPLRESFPDRSWGTAMRWLFSQPEVQAVIRARVASGITEAS